MQSFSVIAWLVERLGLPASWGEAYVHVVMASLVGLFLIVASLLAWRRLRHTESCLLPEGYASGFNVLQLVVESIYNLMVNIMGPNARAHLPLVATLFIYILVSDLTGVIPGFIPPTENINTNLACALVVFIYYNAVGIRTQGLRNYLKHMTGPVVWLAPLILAIELVSHFVRPVSLSVRLLGNIAGDHIVLGIFSSLVPLFLPIIFMALSLFVAFIQAFVFTLLTIIYIHMAQASEEGH